MTRGKKRSITVIIVPHNQIRTYKFKLPMSLFYLLGGLGLVACITSSLFFMNIRSCVDLRRAKEELARLNESMVEVAKLDRKLRVMTGQEPKEVGQQMVAQGGVSSVDLSQTLGTRPSALIEDVRRMQRIAELQASSLQEMSTFLEDQTSRIAATPSINPLKRCWLSSGFGYRVSPFTGQRRMHEGVDLVARVGTPVMATADGTVTFVGWKKHYGRTVIIDHGYGYQTRYCHNKSIKVERGQRVNRYQVIATLGNSGLTTGPHVHYEVRCLGVPRDPLNYILNTESIS
jgi:murein DD-endopeptidase MepM/ murein hydrolase activator NlpD